MKKLFCCYLSLFIIITAISCKENIVTTEEIPPGRRDYVWKSDSIYLPFSSMYDIWGNSIDNIWMTGYGPADSSIWHFNGTNWKPASFSSIVNSPNAVLGFSSGNIYFAGERGGLYKYCSGVLSFVGYADSLLSEEININKICGQSENEIFLVGEIYSGTADERGVIYRFNGKTFSRINIDEYLGGFVKIEYIPKLNQYAILGMSFYPKSLKLFLFNGAKIKLIKSSGFGSDWINYDDLDGNLWLSQFAKIYFYKNNDFRLYKEFNDGINIGIIFGRSQNDIILERNNSLYHFNGKDLAEFFGIIRSEREAIGLYEILPDGVAIVIKNPSAGYFRIVRGILK